MLGKNLDHPAHRACTIQRRYIAAYDLHPLDLIEHHALDLSGAQRGRTCTRAVDQNQHLPAVAAAQENAADTAHPAVLREFESRLTPQQAGKIGNLRVSYIFLSNDRGVCDGVGELLLDSRCGHHHRVAWIGGRRLRGNLR